MADRVGFEPTVRFPVRWFSSLDQPYIKHFLMLRYGAYLFDTAMLLDACHILSLLAVAPSFKRLGAKWAQNFSP